MDCGWAGLPERASCSILSNLFGEDRLSFSLTCKLWNQSSRNSPFRHSPCLVYRTSCGWNLYQYNASLSVPLSKHISPDDEIRCVKYGWMLIMSRRDLNVFFFNPFNSEKITLPKPASNYTSFCFFYPPTSQKCFLVGISASSKDVTIGLLKVEENEWHRYVHDTNTNTDFWLSKCTPVLHQRLLYYLDVYGRMATLDVDECESPDCWKVKLMDRMFPHICENFLVGLNDELFAVLDVKHEERSVYVFRMVWEPSVRWEAVEDLGEKVLYVSHTASFAATAPCTGMTNRIYFPKNIEGFGGGFVFYSLKDQVYGSINTEYSHRGTCGLRGLDSATWIVAQPGLI